MSQREIANWLPMIKTGVDIAALGRFFLEKGFNVSLKFWVRGLWPKWLGADDDEELRKILQTNLSGRNGYDWNWYRNRLLKFVNAGGQLKLEPVWHHEIISELESKRPTILNVNPFLVNREGRMNKGHYVVPIYVTDKNVPCTKPMIRFIDPWDGKEGCEYLEEIMFACHMWFGSCLFIRPKDKSK